MISGIRYCSGRIVWRTHIAVVLLCDSDAAAAIRRQRKLIETDVEIKDIPRFCRAVTRSALGSSTIRMPNTSISSRLARSNTSLNCRECDPSTIPISHTLNQQRECPPFSLISGRLMGLRENSQDSAYRTKPLDNCSRLPLPRLSCVSSMSSSSSSSSNVSCGCRRCVWEGSSSVAYICQRFGSPRHCDSTHYSFPDSRHCLSCDRSPTFVYSICCRRVDAPQTIPHSEVVLASTSLNTSSSSTIAYPPALVACITVHPHSMRPP